MGYDTESVSDKVGALGLFTTALGVDVYKVMESLNCVHIPTTLTHFWDL
jgi:hypothetical protein